MVTGGSQRLHGVRIAMWSRGAANSRTLHSTPESGARAVYYGAKRSVGPKIHDAMDTLCHLLVLHASPANAQDRAQVERLRRQNMPHGVQHTG